MITFSNDLNYCPFPPSITEIKEVQITWFRKHETHGLDGSRGAILIDGFDPSFTGIYSLDKISGLNAETTIFLIFHFNFHLFIYLFIYCSLHIFLLYFRKFIWSVKRLFSISNWLNELTRHEFGFFRCSSRFIVKFWKFRYHSLLFIYLFILR